MTTIKQFMDDFTAAVMLVLVILTFVLVMQTAIRNIMTPPPPQATQVAVAGEWA